MTICPSCRNPCCDCDCPGCHCKIQTGPNGVQCCTMCITGLQRTMNSIMVQQNSQVIESQGVQSPKYMEQILQQRLQENQLNRFNS